jgi:hypothetical protein
MFYSFFWVIPRRLNFMRRRFGTLFHLYIWCKQEEEPGRDCTVIYTGKGLAQK